MKFIRPPQHATYFHNMLPVTLKNDYTPIPDVDLEEGTNVDAIDDVDSDTEGEQTEQQLAEKYPEANDKELKFLGALDKAIAKYSDPKVSLPRVPTKGNDIDAGSSESSSGSDSFTALLESLKLPTTTLVVCVGASLGILATNNKIYEVLFPYVSCIVIFLSTVSTLRTRFLERSSLIVSRIDCQAKAVDSKVQKLSSGAIAQLDKAEVCMDQALSAIRDKLDKVTELEAMLQVIDPTIDIPDVSDIEEAFDGCSDKLKKSFEAVSDGVSTCVSNVIPAAFRSLDTMEKRFLYPFLAVVLAIQLVGVWFSQNAIAKANAEDLSVVVGTVVDSVNVTTDYYGYDSSNSSIYINSTMGGDYGNSTSNSTFIVAIDDTEDPTSQWDLISGAVQTWLATVVELVTVFILSQIALIIQKINGFIGKIEDDVNGVLNKHVGGTFDLVFNKVMGGVREKMLKLIRDVEKIEGPLKKAIEMKEAQGNLQALKEKALADAKAKAAEAAEKARAEAEAKLAQAKAEAAAKLEQAKAEAAAKLEQAKGEAEAKAREAAEKAKAEAAAKLGQAKEAAEAKAREAVEKAKREVANKAAEAKRKAEKAKATAAKLKKFAGGKGFGF